MERAFPTHREEPGVDESLQVVTQRRRGHADVRLNVTGRSAVLPGLNDEAQGLETHGVAERGECFGVAGELRGHPLLLIFSM